MEECLVINQQVVDNTDIKNPLDGSSLQNDLNMFLRDLPKQLLQHLVMVNPFVNFNSCPTCTSFDKIDLKCILPKFHEGDGCTTPDFTTYSFYIGTKPNILGYQPLLCGVGWSNGELEQLMSSTELLDLSNMNTYIPDMSNTQGSTRLLFRVKMRSYGFWRVNMEGILFYVRLSRSLVSLTIKVEYEMVLSVNYNPQTKELSGLKFHNYKTTKFEWWPLSFTPDFGLLLYMPALISNMFNLMQSAGDFFGRLVRDAYNVAFDLLDFKGRTNNQNFPWPTQLTSVNDIPYHVMKNTSVIRDVKSHPDVTTKEECASVCDNTNNGSAVACLGFSHIPDKKECLIAKTSEYPNYDTDNIKHLSLSTPNQDTFIPSNLSSRCTSNADCVDAPGYKCSDSHTNHLTCTRYCEYGTRTVLRNDCLCMYGFGGISCEEDLRNPTDFGVLQFQVKKYDFTQMVDVDEITGQLYIRQLSELDQVLTLGLFNYLPNGLLQYRNPQSTWDKSYVNPVYDDTNPVYLTFKEPTGSHKEIFIWNERYVSLVDVEDPYLGHYYWSLTNASGVETGWVMWDKVHDGESTNQQFPCTFICKGDCPDCPSNRMKLPSCRCMEVWTGQDCQTIKKPRITDFQYAYFTNHLSNHRYLAVHPTDWTVYLMEGQEEKSPLNYDALNHWIYVWHNRDKYYFRDYETHVFVTPDSRMASQYLIQDTNPQCLIQNKESGHLLVYDDTILPRVLPVDSNLLSFNLFWDIQIDADAQPGPEYGACVQDGTCEENVTPGACLGPATFVPQGKCNVNCGWMGWQPTAQGICKVSTCNDPPDCGQHGTFIPSRCQCKCDRGFTGKDCTVPQQCAHNGEPDGPNKCKNCNYPFSGHETSLCAAIDVNATSGIYRFQRSDDGLFFQLLGPEVTGQEQTCEGAYLNLTDTPTNLTDFHYDRDKRQIWIYPAADAEPYYLHPNSNILYREPPEGKLTLTWVPDKRLMIVGKDTDGYFSVLLPSGLWEPNFHGATSNQLPDMSVPAIQIK